MKNQRMFAHLEKVYNGDLGNDIDIGNHLYKVFSSYIQSPNVEIIQNQFSEFEKKNYIDKAIEKSKITFNKNIDYSKKMITLITCSSNSKNRIIVHAIEE